MMSRWLIRLTEEQTGLATWLDMAKSFLREMNDVGGWGSEGILREGGNFVEREVGQVLEK